MNEPRIEESNKEILQRIDRALFGDEKEQIEGMITKVNKIHGEMLGDFQRRGLVGRIAILEWWKRCEEKVLWILVPILTGLLVKVLFFPQFNLLGD